MPYQLDQIDPTKTAMIVVDMQNDFVAKGAKLQSAAAAAMVPKLAATLNFCREKGIRVIYTAHVHRRDGSDMGLYDRRRRLSTELKAQISSLDSLRLQANTSSRSTATARSSPPISTSSCVSGHHHRHHLGNHHRELLPRYCARRYVQQLQGRLPLRCDWIVRLP
jgi:nicotinamidase-related amidase